MVAGVYQSAVLNRRAALLVSSGNFKMLQLIDCVRPSEPPLASFNAKYRSLRHVIDFKGLVLLRGVVVLRTYHVVFRDHQEMSLLSTIELHVAIFCADFLVSVDFAILLIE